MNMPAPWSGAQELRPLQDTGEVAGYFDHLGPYAYDQVIRANDWPANRILRGALSRFLPYTPDLSLDLGAGTAASSDVVLQETQPSRHVAVEASATMAAWLRRWYADDPRVMVEETAAEAFLADATDRFDLATAIGLVHFTDVRAILAGVARVLNKGKWFAFTFDVATLEHPPQQKYDVTVYRNSLYAVVTEARRRRLDVVGGRYFTPKPAVDPDYLSHFLILQKI